jgi:hypothetical protein
MTPPNLGAAYEVAVAAERARSEPANGYRVYYMATGRFGSFDVPADPSLRSFVVVGRHSMCDVVLDGDLSIALRHLLLRAARLDDGCPRLSVLDLHTNLGFELAGGRHGRSIAVTGPLALSVGAFALIALPGGEKLPDVLPMPVCSVAMVPHPYREAPVSSVTILPPAKDLSETRNGFELGGGNANTDLVVSLRGARGSAAVRLSPLELEQGVLVGRAPKCSEALRNVLNEGISRVHLLLRKGVAYDIASTQGTFVPNGGGGWQRVRRVAIEPGTRMLIGSVNGIHVNVASG